MNCYIENYIQIYELFSRTCNEMMNTLDELKIFVKNNNKQFVQNYLIVH